ncbi:MAG: ABC transporter permease, partial [Bacteroidales bacterium]|nr:ABC transporter permease [Bacteroidales bacterium]
VLCGVLPVLLANGKRDEKKVVAVVDQNPMQKYAKEFYDTDEYVFLKVQDETEGSSTLYNYYEQNKADQKLYAIVQIPDSISKSFQFNVYSDQSINANLERDVKGILRPILEKEKIESFGIDSLEDIMKQCKVELNAKNIKWGETGEEEISSAEIGMVIGIILSFLTYMFVLMYGAMIMNGVIEEKTNRIVEVIVSSCKPMELMLGKIIGVALVGFTQIIIWAVLMGIAGTILGASTLIGGATDPAAMTQAMGQNPEAMAAMEQIQNSNEFSEIIQMILSVNYLQIMSFFIIYFVGGYLLYASLFAAFGSAVDQPSDASQFMTPIMLIMVFSLYAGLFSIENPDGPLCWWCSIIPFTSPIVMMIRLPYEVPIWEMILSIALLYGCAFGILYIAGKIYRTGILMYGKKV